MSPTRHHGLTYTVGGLAVPYQPPRDPWWWSQRRRERACRREVGHCWHPLSVMGCDWFCCVCGRETDGWPPQRCVYCVAGPP